MSTLSRRQFGKLVLGSIAVSLLGNCGAEELSQAPDTAQPTRTTALTPTSTSSPAPTASPTLSSTPTSSPALSPAPTSPPTPSPAPTATRATLRNMNPPGFFVRYYKPFEAVDPESWTLSVEGLVLNAQELTLPEVLSLDRVAQVSRMKCVECWSAAASWEGFHLRSLLGIVNPHPDAKWVRMYCADGYYESLSIEELLRDRVLFVHHMNDNILPDIYGAPLRLMVPFLYGYKSAKAIVRLEFARDELPGYWPSTGPYTTHGVIRRGRDNPLDLEGTREIRGGSEIFYPDGIESRPPEGS